MFSSPSADESGLTSSSTGPATPPAASALMLRALEKNMEAKVGPLSAKTVAPETPGALEASDIPKQLLEGVSMLKVSAKKVVQRRVRISPEVGQIHWESRTGGVLNIELIRELRFGADARGYREALGRARDSEARWTSIIYASAGDKKIKVLHLVALTAELFASWKTALNVLYGQRRDLMGGVDQTQRRQNVWLQQHWRMASTGNDGKLNFSQVVSLCRSLGIAARSEELWAHFEQADGRGHGFLDFADFQSFVRLLKRRSEVEQLLRRFSGGRSYLDTATFGHFMRKAQHSHLSDDVISTIFKRHCDGEDGKMSAEGFTSFLLSNDNSAFPNSLSHDMSRPLCEYFISSSHNTYLIGSQLKGDSTTEGYIRALQQGCRSVELDIWDGQNGQPVVYHGRTLTKRIAARDILLAIAKYAFVASPFPVTLSLEVHCDGSQQVQLARMLKDILGRSLVTVPLRSEGVVATLPSPEELKYRFLIKAKNLDASLLAEEGDETLGTDEGDISSSSTSSDVADIRVKLGTALRRFSSDGNAVGLTRRSPQDSRQSHEPASMPKLHPELVGLLVYAVGVKFRGFNKKEQYAPTHMLSLSERRAARIIKDAADEMIAHNRTHLMRAYPSISRFTSSNFLPQNFWVVGMQMVAINWQTFDLGAEINGAMFQRNGKCGYVLKPEVLRSKGAIKDKELLAAPVKYTLEIKVISAQQLSRTRSREEADEHDRARLSPCVEVAIYAPNQLTVPRRRSASVIGNGFNPIFPDSGFSLPFEVVGGFLDLVFLRLQVFDQDSDGLALGRYCVPLGSLAPGYRHVPLYDAMGQQFLFSSLFLHTKIEKA